MGVRYPFTCSACGYISEVSGGRDFGMVFITRTITCLVCRELFDVQVGGAGRDVEDDVAAEPEGKLNGCPTDASHAVRLWGQGHECPRCSTRMTAGPATVLWD